MSHLFGTDGIRGIANKDLNIELLTKLGKTLSLFKINKVVIGQDTRISSPMLSFALISSCLSMGMNVYDEGIVTTPCLSYVSEKLNSIGVMITASHNPYYYNGIKVFINGKKLTKEQEFLIEENMNNDYKCSDFIGTYEKSSYKNKYIESINRHKNRYNNLRIGLDLANGATSFLARDIYQNITNSLYTINSIPNGYNINENVGSTHINTLIDYVNIHNLDIGFSYDGDGDRVIAVSRNGNIISGNLIIYILALYLFDELGYPNRSVVLTKDTNIGVIKSFNERNINVLISDIGDANVKELMVKNSIVLGGEDSGHIITPFSEYGDGILTSLLLLNALYSLDKDLDYFTNKLILYPFIQYNISKYQKDILNEEQIKNLITKLKDEFSNDGSVLIRASGTENLIRVYMCHKDQDILNNANTLFTNTLDMVGKKYER